jgi:hypothetical protein
MKHNDGAKSHQPSGGGVFGSPLFWIAVIVIAVGAMIWLALPKSQSAAPRPKTSAEVAPAASGALPEKVIGRWLRNDGGGYTVEIRSVLDGGKFEAAYFNPSPINVSRAEWGREEGKLRVFLELRDRNYDGATYTLLYDAEQDRLAGVYFQPALGQSFAVEFDREK